jgi:hypothetical protein
MSDDCGEMTTGRRENKADKIKQIHAFRGGLRPARYTELDAVKMQFITSLQLS